MLSKKIVHCHHQICQGLSPHEGEHRHHQLLQGLSLHEREHRDHWGALWMEGKVDLGPIKREMREDLYRDGPDSPIQRTEPEYL